jgi:hypothetical protein
MKNHFFCRLDFLNRTFRLMPPKNIGICTMKAKFLYRQILLFLKM